MLSHPQLDPCWTAWADTVPLPPALPSAPALPLLQKLPWEHSLISHSFGHLPSQTETLLPLAAQHKEKAHLSSAPCMAEGTQIPLHQPQGKAELPPRALCTGGQGTEGQQGHGQHCPAAPWHSREGQALLSTALAWLPFNLQRQERNPAHTQITTAFKKYFKV